MAIIPQNKSIIPQNKSIIIAGDVPYEQFESLLKETAHLDIVGGYKVGVSFLDVGLRKVVDCVRQYTSKPIIYDHQKAGNDIPQHIPQQFMDAMLRAGVDAVILFPFTGPVSQYEWTKAAQERNLGVIVGGEMTHLRFMQGDWRNETNKKDVGNKKDTENKNYTEIFLDLGMHRDLSGYIHKFASQDIYELAARMGVQDFVLPGTKLSPFKEHKALVTRIRGCKPTFYSTGFITQGGNLSKAAQIAGEKFHPIVGRAITEAEDKRNAVEFLKRVLLDIED